MDGVQMMCDGPEMLACGFAEKSLPLPPLSRMQGSHHLASPHDILSHSLEPYYYYLPLRISVKKKSFAALSIALGPFE